MSDLPVIFDEVRAQVPGLVVFYGPYNLNLFLVRAVPGKVDAFDDVAIVAYQDRNPDAPKGSPLAWVVEVFTGITVDPGKPAIDDPKAPDGTPWIATGQSRSVWKIGRHRGKPGPALVQVAPIPVRRDRNRDGRPETPSFGRGINLHPMSTRTGKVGGGSEGCVGGSAAFVQRIVDLVKLQAGRGYGDTVSVTAIERAAGGADPAGADAPAGVQGAD